MIVVRLLSVTPHYSTDAQSAKQPARWLVWTLETVFQRDTHTASP